MLPLIASGSVRAAQNATPSASQTILSGGAPLALTGKRRADFEAYVAGALAEFNVPGAAVAVVQNGDVVYLKGFGVTAFGGTQAVDADTMFMIGSITKPLTTLLAANLVDDGLVTWDTRLVDLLPDFAVGDPALTEGLTVHDAFCNCSGVPGRNIESSFESGNLTPERVVTSLANVAPTAPFGQEFIYNNLLVATGGYALGVANGGTSDDVGLAYDMALRERVLGPIGMARSTFDPEQVLAGGNYALPHADDLSGNLRPLPLTAERVLLPFRPAGALWSNAREMVRFLQTELSGGVAPDGTRVASPENLETTWAPGVSVPNYYGGPPQMAAAMTGYGLGWVNGDYRGLRVISHNGGTGGFTAEMAFLPAANLGMVILANALSLTPIPLGFEFAIQFRLFEILFDQPAEFAGALTAAAAARSRPALGTVDPAVVTPYLGRYSQPELGEVTIVLRGERLILDAGEVSSELRPRADDRADPPVYLLHDPPLSLFSEIYGATLTFSGAANAPRLTLKLPANVTGPEQTFVFEPIATAQAAPD